MLREPFTRPPERLLAQQHVARGGLRLKTRRKVGHLADRAHVGVGYERSDYRRSDCDPDSDWQTGRIRLVANRDRGLYSLHRVIEPRAAHVEGRHHRVASELVDHAVVALDLLSRPAVKARDLVDQVGRWLIRDHRGVAADVREHDRDDALLSTLGWLLWSV